MSDDHTDNNLISYADRLLSHTVPRNPRDAIRALKSCEGLLPLADDLGLVLRCVDAVAAKATASVPTALFGSPVGANILQASSSTLCSTSQVSGMYPVALISSCSSHTFLYASRHFARAASTFPGGGLDASSRTRRASPRVLSLQYSVVILCKMGKAIPERGLESRRWARLSEASERASTQH